MIDNSNPTGSGSRLGRYKFVWLLLLLLVVLLAVAAYWRIPGWNAAEANRIQFEQWAAMGIPYDDATMEKFYNERTHPEGSPDWLEITQLLQWGEEVESFKQLPYLGSEGETPTTLVPSGDPADWPEEPLVASYLKEMEPVIDLIEEASLHPTPVRFPIKFQGFGTLIDYVQDARSILRLLSLDFDFAYFNQDNERALRDLSLMKATAEAYDGRECLVSELVNIALRQMRMGSIRRTLTHCRWSAAELETLRNSLASKEDISTRWQDTMFGERALGLSSVDMPSNELAQLTGQSDQQTRFRFFDGPAEVKTLMEAYQRIIEIPIGSDINNWRKRSVAVEDWVKSLPQNSLAGMLAPATSTILEAELRSEDARRWTLTAVAIQQFKQQNQRWPKDLGELESVGLNFEDYSDTEKNVFGYEIEGDKVFLWKRPPQGGGGNKVDRLISKTRPQPEEGKDLFEFMLELN